MKVIDILNKHANGEEMPKKIKYANDVYVLNNYTDAIERLYVWKNDDDIGWFEREYVTLHSEVEVIEEKPEKGIKELPCLEYIKNDEPDKLTYGSWTIPCNDTERFLSLIINRVIKTIDDMGDRLDNVEKNLNEHKKDLLSHNGAPIILTTGLENDGLAISKTESQKLADAFTKI